MLAVTESCCADRWSESPADVPALTLTAEQAAHYLDRWSGPTADAPALTLTPEQVAHYKPFLEHAALAMIAAMPTRPPATASETRKAQVAARRADLLETAQALRRLHALMPDPD